MHSYLTLALLVFVSGLAQAEELSVEELKAKSAAFVPNDDSRVWGTWGNDHALLAMHQYKLVFYKLPKYISVEAREKRSEARLYRKDGAEVALSKFKPHKTITFKNRIELVQREKITKHVLACTDPQSIYTAANEEEETLIRMKGYDHGAMPWINEKGEIDDFCGIISVDGSTVYKFPVKQSVPNVIATKIDVSSDGKRAVIGVGKQRNPDEGYGAGIDEILVWEFPDKLKRIDNTTNSFGTLEILGKFRSGEY